MLNLNGYRLTFDEEFNQQSISRAAGSTTWGDIRSEWRLGANADIGFGSSSFVDPASGYNPFSTAGGVLNITAVPDRTAAGYPGSWESGLITTQGSFSQVYGYFEIRADFSDLAGAWDAFWLLPDVQILDPHNADGWQELDIVEHYGSWDKGVYSTIHTTDPQNGIPWQENRQIYSELAEPAGYHVYGMLWKPDRISFYVDGQPVGSQVTPSDMHRPMYLLADLATQTNPGGNNANAANVPIRSSIDYIRVYSSTADGTSVVLDEVSSPDGQDPGLYGATSRLNGFAPSVTRGSDPSRTGSTTDVLLGGPGADRMLGGEGNDLYEVTEAGDLVIEAPGQGIDTVFAYVNYQLPDHVEVLSMAFGTQVYGVGNAGDNTILGNAQANVIQGGAGYDVLVGGAGADLFVVHPGFGVDYITDFAPSGAGHDAIAFSSRLFASYAAVMANAAQVGADTWIGDGQGNTVVLAGVSLASLQAEDFGFF